MNDPKTHQQIRYETAGEMLLELEKLTTADEKRDYLERTLLIGERRGLMASVEYLKFQITSLRKKHTNGVANHIQQAVSALYDWAIHSDNFTLYVRPDNE